MQESGVEGAADWLVPTEAEGDIGDAAADLAAGAQPLDLRGRLDEIHGIIVVLRQAGANGEDVGVENDVLRLEANLLHQYLVRSPADADLREKGGCEQNLGQFPASSECGTHSQTIQRLVAQSLLLSNKCTLP